MYWVVYSCVSMLTDFNGLANYSNWQSFHWNSKELAKVPLVATEGHFQVMYSLDPSDFVFFAERELSQHFYIFISATIQLLVAVWLHLSHFALYMEHSLPWHPNVKSSKGHLKRD